MKRLTLFVLLLALAMPRAAKAFYFQDPAVKAICVANWDTNGDGDLSYTEAAAVTSLGTAFRGNTDITSFLELQYFTSLTSLTCDDGYGTFQACYNLDLVYLPDALTTIGRYAFYDCRALRRIEIPSAVTLIDESAFESCWTLYTVDYRGGCDYSSLNTINEGAFSRCDVLTSFSIPYGVTEISANTFSYSGLRQIEIPSQVTSIGNYAFYHCVFLRTLTLCNNLTSIGEYAFEDCSVLTTLGIPNSVTSIGASAFQNCTGLTTVNLGSSLHSIEESTFQNCSALTTLNLGSYLQIIGESAFKNCSGLIVVTIPNNVTTIEKYAFENCSSLTSLDLGSHVTTIKEYAFEGCIGLSSLTIPSSVTTIKKNAFNNCTNLTSVTINSNALASATYSISEDLSGIHYDNFRSRFGNQVTSYTFGSNVTAIGDYACYNCTGMTSVNLGYVATIGNYAFRGCSGLTSLTIPNYVTSIGEYAFYNCSGMTSVIIGNSLTSISNSTFGHCSGMTTVTIPSSVTSIGSSAFSDCSGLTRVNYTGTLGWWCNISFSTQSSNPLLYAHNLYINNELMTTPDFTTNGTNVTSINPYAFTGCTGLNSVNISSFVTYIGNHAFKDCTGLTSVTIRSNDVLTATFSESYNLGTIFGAQVESYTINGYGSTWVTHIGAYTFRSCHGMTSLTLGNITNVTSIGAYAFYQCRGLTSVTIPNSVTYIGSYAFYGCSGMTSLTIGSYVQSIGYKAFSGCSSLQSITCRPSTPPTLGNYAFEYVTMSIPVNVPCNAKAAYQAANGWSDFTNIVDPCEAIQFEDPYVKEICVNYDNWDFNNDDELSYLEAAAVTSLGIAFKENAFIVSFNELQYFTGLESLNTTAGYGTFQSCPQLTSIVLPNSLTSIGDEAFSDCSSLTSIVIPNSVTSIGNAAFSDCESLTSIVLPDSLTSIGSNAFYGCSSLASIEIPNSVTSIGNYAFYWCVSLTSIEIPNSVTSIGNYMFYNCSSLTSIEISNSVTSIGNYAFNGCSGLTSLSIPNSVASIGQNAFGDCQGLTSIVVAAGNATYDSRDNCNAIIETNTNTLVAGCQNTVIPSTVISIGNCAFSDCSGLTSIEIPNSVTSIGNSAFSYCSSLTSIEIPNSVTSIGNYAFSDCGGLTSMTVQATTPPTLGNNAFQNVPTSIHVTVPCGSLSNYQNATGWSNFTNLVENCTQQLTVNDGTVENSYVPVYGYWCDQYSKSQFIIPASDLQTLQQNVITKLTFYSLQSNVSWDDALFDVYLAEVEETEFEDATLDWSGMTKVLENASLSIADNKMEVLLSQPYLYQGGNLKVGIKQVVSGSYVSCTWFGVSNENNVAIGGYEYTRALSLYPFLPKTTFDYIISTVQSNIEFADPNVKAICVAHWDTNGDGELSYEEAAAVTTLKPAGVTNSVFYYTDITSFNELQYFTGLTSIEQDAFRGCTNLASVVFPNSVTKIMSRAFFGCTHLANLNIPSGVTQIYAGAFYNCRSLTSITIPESVTNMWDNPFAGCSALESITVASGNTVYDSRDNCNAIIVTANNKLFSGCQNTVIPDVVTSIGTSAFDGCTALTSVTLPSGLTSIGEYAFSMCTGLTSMTIPEGVTSIGFCAFQDCSNLNTITLPNGITSIEYNTFYGCSSLASVNIPDGVTSIGQFAFRDCSGLTSITVMATTPPILYDNSVFGNVNSGIPVTVPCESLAAYQTYNNGQPWGGFSNIKTLNEQFPWTEDFEIYAGLNNNNTNYNTMPSCWSSIHGANPAQNYYDRYPSVYTYSSYAHSGSNFIFFADNYNTDYTHSDQYAILPPVENVNRMTLSFYALKEYRTAYFEVGVMTDPEDASTFTMVGSATATTTHTLYSFSFANYSGTGTYIAIRMPKATSGNNRGVCIDDVTLDHVINFADPAVKALCVANWDTNGDGELSYSEAAAVTTLNPSGESNNSVFKGKTSITSFDELQYFTGLTGIDAYAFYGCTNLAAVILPSGVDSINTHAFHNCSSLFAIALPDNLTYIGMWSFTGCTSLTSITFPTSLQTIDVYAFSGAGLTSIFLPASVTSIAPSSANRNIFTGCPLESITVDADNTVYDSRDNCNAIIWKTYSQLIIGCKNSIIPSTVTSIGYEAFSGCTGLASLTIPNSVTIISKYAFSGCTGLTSINIPSGVTNIPDYAFNNCTGLISLTVDATTPPTLGTNAFRNVPTSIPVYVPCGTKAAYQTASGWSVFTNFVDPCEAIVFDDPVVKALCVANWDTNGDGELSYPEAAAVTTLKPDGVTYSVFYDNSSIETFDELQYFTGLSTIETRAFYSCSNLTSVTLPDNVTSIGSQAFSYSGLQSITLPEGLTTINAQAFGYCNLTSIHLPSSVRTLGTPNPFVNCSALGSITVDENNPTYDSRDNCNAIIKTTGNQLVVGCKNTVIPSSVTSIGQYAFYGQSEMTSIAIQNSVTYIGQYAFYGCTSLPSITLPETITSIDNGVFSQCTGLQSITLPASITNININAFYSCTGLQSITLPASITNISSTAFYNCTGLQSIMVEATTPPTIYLNTFSYVPTDIPVYVPCESLENYQSASGWSTFTNFVGIDCPEVTQTIVLSAGVNWVSFNVETTLDDLKAALLSALSNASGIKITSQNNGYTIWNGSSWRGSLNSIDVIQMYVVEIPSACEISLEAMLIDPSEHPITIVNGINWIGFPFSADMSLTDAFNGFAVSGDKVISLTDGNATYQGSWSGGVSTLQPGQGYKLEVTTTGQRTFVFPTSSKKAKPFDLMGK